MSVGPLEVIILLAVVLLIFGPKRLPGLGRSLGRSMREFKDGITGKGSKQQADAESTDRDSVKTPELEAARDDEPAQDAEVVEESETDSQS